MTREKFMADLKRGLGRMTEDERREIMYDYEEHFRMGAAEGKGEEQIAQSLGSPRVIGRSYAIDALLEEPSSGGGVKAASVLRAIFASLSLTFFNVIVVLGPLLGLVGVMIGLWAAAISLPLAGVAVAVSPVAAAIVPGIFSLGGMSAAFLVFAGIGVTALGLLAVLGMWNLSLLFVQMVAAYVRFNVRIVMRRK